MERGGIAETGSMDSTEEMFVARVEEEGIDWADGGGVEEVEGARREVTAETEAEGMEGIEEEGILGRCLRIRGRLPEEVVRDEEIEEDMTQ